MPLTSNYPRRRLSAIVEGQRPSAPQGSGYGDLRQWAGQVVEKVRVASVGGKLRFLPWFDPYSDETPEMRAEYRHMLRESSVKAAFQTKVFSVVSEDVLFQVNDDADPREQEGARFCQYAFDRIRGGTLGLGWSVLHPAIMDGHSVCEKVWCPEPLRRGKFAGKRIYHSVKAKDTRFLQLGIDPFRNVTALRGTGFNAGRVWSPDDFVIFTYFSLFENPAGMSDFRAAYRPYWIKDTSWKLRTLHLEKWTGPFIVGHYSNQETRRALEEAFDEAKSSTWLTVPQGDVVECLDLAMKGTSDFKDAISDCDREILIAIVGAHLQILEGQGGSIHGDTSVHQQTGELVQWWLAASLAEVYKEQLVVPLMAENYHDVEPPDVSIGAITDEAMLKRSQVYEGLQKIGLDISKRAAYRAFNMQPPEDKADVLAPPGAGGQGPGGPAPPGGPPMPPGAPPDQGGGGNGQALSEKEVGRGPAPFGGGSEDVWDSFGDEIYHGPEPPGPGWVSAGTGPHGGKLWKREGGKGGGHAGGALPFPPPYKVPLGEAARRVLDQAREKLARAGGDTLRQHGIRIGTREALEKAVGNRAAALVKEFRDWYGDDARALREYRDLNEAGKELKQAAWDLGNDLGTDREVATRAAFDERMLDFRGKALGLTRAVRKAGLTEYSEAGWQAFAAASASRKPGEKWQGPSGKWFTKRQDGRVVPTAAPGGQDQGKAAGAGKPAPAPARAAGKADRAKEAAAVKQAAFAAARAFANDPKSATPEQANAIGRALLTLNVADLQGLKKQLGLKGGGRSKSALVDSIKAEARRVVQAARAKAAAPAAKLPGLDLPEVPELPPAPAVKAARLPPPRPAPDGSMKDRLRAVPHLHEAARALGSLHARGQALRAGEARLQGLVSNLESQAHAEARAGQKARGTARREHDARSAALFEHATKLRARRKEFGAAIERHHEECRQALHQVAGLDDAHRAAIGQHFFAAGTDPVRPVMDRATAFLGPLLGKGSAGQDLDGYHVFLSPGDVRAHYNAGIHGINAGTTDLPASVAVHEMGHGIEDRLDGALPAVREFLQHRLGGEAAVSLNTLPDSSGNYDDSEKGAKDHFDRYFSGTSAYYVGKQYGHGATEVLSMGVQALYEDPARFAYADPEYFAFTLGILRGELRAPNPDEDEGLLI